MQIDIPEIKRLNKDIMDGSAFRYCFLGQSIGIYAVLLNGKTDAVAIFDLHHCFIKTIGPKTWIKKKGDRYIFIPKKEREEIEYKNISQKKDKVPYVRSKFKSKTRAMLQRDEEFLSEDGWD